MEDDRLTIAGKVFSSRLFVGTARYPNIKTMLDALEASGTEAVTVAIRRININQPGETILNALTGKYFIIPNTAGCYTAKEAVLTAKLAREALGTDWVKLEVIGDDETLYPDTVQLLQAAKQLVDEGFVVLPYCNDDPVTCMALERIGCEAVMPLGAPIGSGMGILNPYNIRIIKQKASVPVIVDAGVGTASDVAVAMELGVDGVLVNTAIAQARNPVMMAQAIKQAVEAGRLAYKAGRIPRLYHAHPSSPTEGKVDV
ncbi:MAG: thiazole synthase [Candidatus Caldarchaeum sp.]|nr:thiazole synthase [Candidatus Caldarchaeum sp.]MCX8201482.1 thiazole synthase [Candidatus Caldarchaeum sp.]MDW8063916.1 thiazole synthase [Candidatus Caldarchaeum sp.]MDW8434593.1 thiazole synthase [Candidatus Caldarchaeum sp.]